MTVTGGPGSWCAAEFAECIAQLPPAADAGFDKIPEFAEILLAVPGAIGPRQQASCRGQQASRRRCSPPTACLRGLREFRELPGLRDGREGSVPQVEQVVGIDFRVGFPRDPRQAEFFLESYDIDGVPRPTPSWRSSGARSTSSPWTRGPRRRSSSSRSGRASACRRTSRKTGHPKLREIAVSGGTAPRRRPPAIC